MNEATRTVVTGCPLDCPDSCSLEVSVRDGRVERIDGRAEGGQPLTQGLICGKVRRMDRHLECPERVTTPLRRVGPKGQGRFEPATWDEALDAIASRLGEIADGPHGASAILPVCYGGSNGLLTQSAQDFSFFRRLGAARPLRTLCAAPTGSAYRALYGGAPGLSIRQFERATLIVIWGANPSASGIHLVPAVQAALENGAKLIVVDPRRTPLAKKAHLHLAPLPGTDLPLALGLIRELFERGLADTEFIAEHTTGASQLRAAAEEWTLDRVAEECAIDEEQLEAFVEHYGTAERAALRCGYGLERARSGGYAAAAIQALPAICGHFGTEGQGLMMSNGGAWKSELRPVCTDPDEARAEVNLTRLGRALADGDPHRIEAAFVYNANPLATFPDSERQRRGFEREDLFTVVHDAVLTDTAKYADWVLPATTFLEHEELHASYGSFAMNRIRPAADAPGEARPNHFVFNELLARMGLAEREELPTERDLMLRAFSGFDDPEGKLDKLEQDGWMAPSVGTDPVLFRDVFPNTPDKKIHLAPDVLRDESQTELYAYQPVARTPLAPLSLISPALAQQISSTFGQLHTGQVPLSLHPDDAAARDLSDGQAIRAYNDLGEVQTTLAIDADLRPGVALLPKGLWSHATTNGRPSNALIPDHLSDLGAGACYNDARIQVEALSNPLDVRWR
ncbi:MAG: molybdopterin-containing oxidoreductase family protein [Planctomycetota bacterium]|jgi:anaerobic selenocysteine-containing dehydrogenase